MIIIIIITISNFDKTKPLETIKVPISTKILTPPPAIKKATPYNYQQLLTKNMNFPLSNPHEPSLIKEC